jgi:preprotein translocase subunit SecD
MGPAALSGSQVDDATAAYEQVESQGFQWVIQMQLDGEGADRFNELAAASYQKQPPQNAVAITLDGEVLQAPAFRTANFAGGEVQISGGFTEETARDNAQLIRYGALPVKLKTLTSVSISPTLGQEQLRAGIIAGIIGLSLVLLYALVFYRILGLVIWFGLAMTGMLVWTAIAVLGETQGLALTIAGVCGLIVSVGVTVDSYIVYFERLKDEVRAGRTVRASVDRGFRRSFQTILIADGLALLSAVVLFFLAEGNVKGFAFFLGLSTVLDLAVSYFVMHPLVSILGHQPKIVRAKIVGIGAGIDAPEVQA